MSDFFTLEQIDEIASVIRSQTKYTPKIGLILGSGLGSLSAAVENAEIIPYDIIPGSPVSTVIGHQGRLIFGELEGLQVAVMQGRVHYYEGYSLAQVGLDHGGRAAGEAEALFGRVLAEAPGLRARMVIATKCGIVPGVPYVSTAAHIAASCEASLKRLGCDVADLFQIHRPDVLAHPEEVASALARLREQGKIREVGVSNHTPAQLDTLQRHLPFPAATHQPELSCWEIGPCATACSTSACASA